MRITLLGTGTSQGVPVIGCKCDVCQSSDPRDNRLRTSIMVETEGKTIVVDTGPDFRQQMLSENVDQLDAVLFTHEHKDHMAGLDDIRAFNFIQRKEMTVYASDRVQKALKRDYFYAFEEKKYPGVPQIHLTDLHNEPFEVEGINIIPIEVMHFKLPVFGFRFGDFTYITDANYISRKEKEKIKGSKVMVINALRKTDHISHFTLDEAIDLVNELDVEVAYITHISHQMGLHKDVEKETPDNIHLGYDGLKIEM